MIYTCTLNPSLDYYMEFDEVKLGKTNRSRIEYYEAGGKGINVSIVLNNLMIPSRALGFIGGFTRDFFISLLQKYEFIEPAFTYTEGHTRINVKVKDMETLAETELNAKGPAISEVDMKMMIRRIEKMNRSDMFVLSGNCPDNLVELVEKMIAQCAENKIPFVLDVNTSLYKRLLQYKPLLIKPNLQEMEEISGRVLRNQSELVRAAKECVKQGAENVIISQGAEGSVLINLQGSYHANSIQADIVSTVGAGDSMVAGFVMNYIRSRDIITTFRYANCCGVATAFSKGLATREKIEALYNEIVVEEIKE